MQEIREKVQAKLNNIPNIKCGVAIPDGMVEDGITYFSYEIEQQTISKDMSKNYLMGCVLTGRLVRKIKGNENTLSILDSALESVLSALKELNFDYSFRDVSMFTDGYLKISITANVRYSDSNNILIV